MKFTNCLLLAVALCLAASANATGCGHCPHGHCVKVEQVVCSNKDVCDKVPTCVAGDPQKCYNDQVDKCDIVPDKVCKQVFVKKCFNDPTTVCKNIPKKVCDRKCDKVPVKKCASKPVKVCDKFGCKIIHKQVCDTVFTSKCQNVCKTVFVKSCSKVNNQVCKNEPKTVCDTVQKKVCKKVLVKKCDPFPAAVKCGFDVCKLGEKCEEKVICKKADPVCVKKLVPVCKTFG